MKKLSANLIKFFIIILLIIPLSSCSKKTVKSELSAPLVLRDGLLFKDSLSTTPYTGRHKSRMLDQTIEYEVIDGIRQGDFIIYFPNGKTQMKGTLTDNKNTGTWIYYRSDGSIESKGEYVNDTPSGKWSWYQLNGKLAEDGFFNKGLRDGEWKDYDSTGNLISIIKYKMNTVIDSVVLNK